MTTPIFLTTPEIQSYIDPVEGNCNYTGCIDKISNQIVGFAASTYLSHFNFNTGALYNRQQLSAISVSPGVGSSIIFDTSATHIWSDKDNASNNVGYVQIDPTTTPWTIDATYGHGSGFGDLPNNVPYFISQCYLTFNNTNWLVQGSLVGGAVTVSRADPPNLGFWGHQYLPTGTSAVSVCSGFEGISSATSYWVAHANGPTTCTLGKTEILIGAETYNPMTWPTPNSYISSTSIKIYNPTDFNGTWTQFDSFCGPAFDQEDGNLILEVSGDNGSVHTHYIVKVNSLDGSIIWKVPVENNNGFNDQSLTFSQVVNGVFSYFASTGISTGIIHAIDTSTGTDYTQATTCNLGIGSQISNDAVGCIIGNTGWNISSGDLILLNSTPNSGTSLAATYFIQPSTPPPTYKRCSS